MVSTAVSQECETWSARLREGYKLRVFEKRVLRKIIWCTTDIYGVLSPLLKIKVK